MIFFINCSSKKTIVTNVTKYENNYLTINANFIIFKMWYDYIYKHLGFEMKKYINKIILANNLTVDDLVDTSTLARKGERDGLPLEILNKVDDEGFYVDITNINNLNFDNNGRYFEKPESSKKQIEKVIKDILSGNPIMPVVIDTKGNVLDGNHRMCAFKALGVTEIPVFKSFMNNTVYDNFTTRAIELQIPLEDDFFTKEMLKNIIENFDSDNLENTIVDSKKIGAFIETKTEDKKPSVKSKRSYTS